MQALYDVPAPAKINLFLHVVGKRADGYHLLQSIFALIDWADRLHFEIRNDGRLQRHDSGPCSDCLPPDDLCLRAARLLQQQSGCKFGADIQIEKNLPAGAGMGGGSSDAASTLLALNRLWGLRWPRRKLLELGLQLGADVPFFIGGQNALVEGIGEILHPIKLPKQRFALLKPAQGISTREIFSSPLLARSDFLAIVAGFPAYTQDLEPDKSSAAGLDGFDSRYAEILGSGFGRNDLQKPAEACCEEVVQALAMLKDRFGNSRMTGSGSAVFARIEDEASLSDQPLFSQNLPAGWIGKTCNSLDRHPLQGWAAD